MTLWGKLSKNVGRKKMNYVRSLWILHCRGWCPICPLFPGLDETATGMLSLLHYTAEVNRFSSSPHCCLERRSAGYTGVSEPNAVGDNGRGDDHTVMEWDLCLRNEQGWHCSVLEYKWRFLRIRERKQGLVFSFTINASYSFIKGALCDLAWCHFHWSWKQSDLNPPPNISLIVITADRDWKWLCAMLMSLGWLSKLS